MAGVLLSYISWFATSIAHFQTLDKEGHTMGIGKTDKLEQNKISMNIFSIGEKEKVWSQSSDPGGQGVVG